MRSTRLPASGQPRGHRRPVGTAAAAEPPILSGQAPGRQQPRDVVDRGRGNRTVERRHAGRRPAARRPRDSGRLPARRRLAPVRTRRAVDRRRRVRLGAETASGACGHGLGCGQVPIGIANSEEGHVRRLPGHDQPGRGRAPRPARPARRHRRASSTCSPASSTSSSAPSPASARSRPTTIPPTSHAVPLENVFRAGRAPPRPDAGAGAGRRAGRRGRALPRAADPGGGGMTRPHPADRRRAGREDPLTGGRPRSRSPRRTWTGSRPSTAPCTPSCTSRRSRRWQRRPLVDAALRRRRARPRRRWPASRWRSRTSFTTTDMPTTCGSKILEGWRPPYDATVTARLRAAGHHDPGQDEHGRVRDGLVHRELGVRAHPQPVGHRPDPRRLRRRLGRGAGRVRGAAGDRHGHRRLDPAARRGDRHGRRQADLRRGVPLRPHRLRVVAGPGRAVRAHGARHRAAARGDRRARPARLHLDRRAGARRSSRRRAPGRPATSTGVRIGVVRELGGEGYQPGVRARLPRRRSSGWRSSAPRSSRSTARTSSTRWPPTT